MDTQRLDSLPGGEGVQPLKPQEIPSVSPDLKKNAIQAEKIGERHTEIWEAVKRSFQAEVDRLHKE